MPAQTPNDRRPRALAFFLALTALCWQVRQPAWGGEEAIHPPEGGGRPDVSTDDLQRSLRLDTYRSWPIAARGAAKTFTSISVGCATTNTPRAPPC